MESMCISPFWCLQGLHGQLQLSVGRRKAECCKTWRELNIWAMRKAFREKAMPSMYLGNATWGEWQWAITRPLVLWLGQFPVPLVLREVQGHSSLTDRPQSPRQCIQVPLFPTSESHSQLTTPSRAQHPRLHLWCRPLTWGRTLSLGDGHPLGYPSQVSLAETWPLLYFFKGV